MARSAVTVDARVAVATLKRELSRRPSLTPTAFNLPPRMPPLSIRRARKQAARPYHQHDQESDMT